MHFSVFHILYLYYFVLHVNGSWSATSSKKYAELDTNLVFEEKDGMRGKRQATLFEIEILMVTDFSVYSFWLKKTDGDSLTERQKFAKQKMAQYYALLFDAIDSRFNSISGHGYSIKLLFAGFHIADAISKSPLSENSRNDNVSPNKINALDGIASFKEWIRENSDILPQHDHAMLFTRYALESDGDSGLTGLTYHGGLCGENRVSIVKDTFHASTATYAAQQLGFNLNAQHDGDGNDCGMGLGYIMDFQIVVGLDITTNRRLWKFSSCSKENIGSFISYLNRKSLNCMSTRSSTYNSSVFEGFVNDLLGQLYPPDSQCAAIDGPGSHLCREFLDFDYSSICARMACSHPENNGSCWLRIPWEGTTCGNGKVCIQGYCVAHDLAPYGLTETCLFGDQPETIANENKTCNQLIALEKQTFACYYYDEQCCDSCADVKMLFSHLTDCPYGDKAPWCSSIISVECYANDDICCSHCLQFKLAEKECQYGDKAEWCSSLTHDECYYNDAICCLFCKQFYTGVQDCEYGDKHPSCLRQDCHRYDNKSRTEICCSSCADYEKTTTLTRGLAETWAALSSSSGVTSSGSVESTSYHLSNKPLIKKVSTKKVAIPSSLQFSESAQHSQSAVSQIIMDGKYSNLGKYTPVHSVRTLSSNDSQLKSTSATEQILGLQDSVRTVSSTSSLPVRISPKYPLPATNGVNIQTKYIGLRTNSYTVYNTTIVDMASRNAVDTSITSVPSTKFDAVSVQELTRSSSRPKPAANVTFTRNSPRKKPRNRQLCSDAVVCFCPAYIWLLWICIARFRL